jgi:hypothetical protein
VERYAKDVVELEVDVGVVVEVCVPDGEEIIVNPTKTTKATKAAISAAAVVPIAFL